MAFRVSKMDLHSFFITIQYLLMLFTFNMNLCNLYPSYIVRLIPAKISAI